MTENQQQSRRIIPPRDAVVALTLVVLGAVISVLRIPPHLLNGLYAEDGEVFISDWLWRPKWSLFFSPYMGYLHLLPRMLSGLVVLLPVAWWGLATTILACLVVGAVSAGVWLAARALGLGRVAAAAVALIPVLSPLGAVESLGNLCNVHWYCLYLLVWVCCAGRRLTHPYVWAVVVLLCCLTEIQAVILLPFVAIVWWRRRVAWPIVAAWAIGVGAQLVCYVVALRPREVGRPSIASTILGFLGDVVLGGFGERDATVSRALSLVRLGVAGILFLAFVIFAVKTLWPHPRRWLVLFLIALSVVFWVVAVWTNNSVDFGVTLFLFRWGTTASMVLTAAVALVLSEVSWRWWVRAAVVAVLVLLILRGFVADESVRQGGAPSWPQALAASRATCSTADSTKVQTWPDGWYVRLSCSRVP
jgi:hypothetical protein